MVDGGVGAFPEAAIGGGVEGLGEAGIEGGIDGVESGFVDGVGELVDEDVFGGVGVIGVAEEVFLAAGDGWSVGGGAKTAGATIPVDLGLEVGVFGDIGGELVPGHDDEADAIGSHGVEEVGSALEHVLDDPGGFAEGVRGDALGSDDGEAIEEDGLLVEGVEVEVGADGVGEGAGIGELGGGREAVEEECCGGGEKGVGEGACEGTQGGGTERGGRPHGLRMWFWRGERLVAHVLARRQRRHRGRLGEGGGRKGSGCRTKKQRASGAADS
jgi:hypothetical protein